MAGYWVHRIKKAGLLPRMSDTERAALEAGTVWVDKDLFSGRPDFRKLLAQPYPRLNEREQAFLDGPVDQVCRAVDDWTLSRTRKLPDEVWEFLKAQGFFGLNIPERWGGLGFSALGQSAVFGKLASRSMGVSAVVLIPNSVGPAELLLHYGTPEQQEYWLPRLARGQEIPCFALTEPRAGSDAASLQSSGTVYRGENGKPWLRLDWDKRYITLAPVATLLGLACRLKDPEEILGKGPEPGITCVLVSTDTPGVEIGAYHDPMGVPFPVGPTRGQGVELPADRIIGGPAQAGHGWRMLMEALSAGRGISLPAQSAAGAKALCRVTGAYAALREQFGRPIGRMEGVQEPLARIAGLTYLMEAARVYTCGGLDAGHRPPVVSAIVKYRQTELLRQVAQDAMDVFGGAGLCLGPRNLAARAWFGAPIGITVEGANILTRSLITFGQGALRCHPWLLREVRALEAEDGPALRAALLGHAGWLVRTMARARVLSLSRGWLANTGVRGPLAGPTRRLAWAATRFAWLADAGLLALGSRLRARQMLAGRYADALSWMYLCTAVLRRWEAEGGHTSDLPLARWALEHGLWQVQQAFEGILSQFDGRFPGLLLRGPELWWARLNRLGKPPSDRLTKDVAKLMQEPGSVRDRLTAGIFQPADPADPAVRLEVALAKVRAGAPDAEAARDAVLAVDEFAAEEYLRD